MVGGWLLDTNVIAEVMRPRGAPAVKRWLADQPETSLFLSVLTLGEIDKGVANLPVGSPAGLRIEAAAIELERRFGDRILSVSDAAVRRWGRISGTVLRDRGRAPPVIDTLLAATAIEHGLTFVTRNVKDVEATGATLFDPWTAG
ncbi:MAG: type II toxin-antitoxin system VapC family toxin [Alphaproteobacteria bacterium]